jgi:uncharacterized protein YqeY
MYKANQRIEQAEKELFEAKVIEQYLPKALSAVELENELKNIIVKKM